MLSVILPAYGKWSERSSAGTKHGITPLPNDRALRLDRERVGRIRKNKTRLAAGLGAEKGKGAMKLDLTPFGFVRRVSAGKGSQARMLWG